MSLRQAFQRLHVDREFSYDFHAAAAAQYQGEENEKNMLSHELVCWQILAKASQKLCKAHFNPVLFPDVHTTNMHNRINGDTKKEVLSHPLDFRMDKKRRRRLTGPATIR